MPKGHHRIKKYCLIRIQLNSQNIHLNAVELLLLRNKILLFPLTYFKAEMHFPIRKQMSILKMSILKGVSCPVPVTALRCDKTP